MKNYMSLKTGTLIMLAFLTVTGCAAISKPLIKSNQSSRQEYVNNHSELSEEIRRAILQAKVIKGMTKAEVKSSWGEPSRVTYPSTNKFLKEGEELWESDRLLAIPVYVNFENGIVENVNDSLK